MRLLLDSNAYIWAITRPAELSTPARQAIEDPENQRFVSVVSLWEMTVKLSVGKLSLPSNYMDGVDHIGATLLPITVPHLRQVQLLPLHHRDPFDRMIIAQAQEENLTIVTRDRHFRAYGVPLLAA
ncbi:MAG: type II toxin-antitoxin system VapC family toxin [Rhodospirillales bacterium]|nr:type II toxin-antitoxin system VapC family toxin [Rhodospirillales bacterium]